MEVANIGSFDLFMFYPDEKCFIAKVWNLVFASDGKDKTEQSHM